MNDDLYFKEDYLEHYGTKRHSGRYKYGSGKDPYQHELTWLENVRKLRDEGKSENDIAKYLGMSSTEFRKQLSVSRDVEKKYYADETMKLKEKGYSNTAIAERLHISEGSVRNYIKGGVKERADKTRITADTLKDYVDNKRYVDIGPGGEIALGVTPTKFKTAVKMLEDEGYKKQYIQINQMGTNHQTYIPVLTPGDVEYSELWDHRFDISDINLSGVSRVFDSEGNVVKLGAINPVSVDSKRIYIRYAEDGGKELDGTIYLRRGVDDISLGNASYAQTRIAVDGKYYMKGMALYSDDIPEGYDIAYNSNKPKGSPPEKVFKEMKSDPENPFGASIKTEQSQLKLAQRNYIDKDGIERQSCINIVNEEGDWGSWSKTLSSQFLSKQSPALAKRQLDLAYAEKAAEFAEIQSVTNPVIKKKLLYSFAGDCDASAVDLKAAAFPKQASKVILPFNDLKEDECYDPELPEGTKVCLIRYPHGGTFEIPTLTVRNNGTEAKKVLGNAVDAIGINHKAAGVLSGADFDGDTVIVIPLSNKVQIKTSKPFEELKTFDTNVYELPKDAPAVTSREKQLEMGKVTNLITDMTLKGAESSEIVRAVKHSMVVIDSEKHHLDYKRSYDDNKIEELKRKYQDNGDGHMGAGTIISRASSEFDILERKVQSASFSPYNAENGTGNVDPNTGRLIFKETGKAYINVKGVDPKTGEPKTNKLDTSKIYILSKNSDGKDEYKKASDQNVLNDILVKRENTKTGKETPYLNLENAYTKTFNKETNEFEYKKLNVSKSKLIFNTQKSTKMAEVDDAYKLTSGGSKENPGTVIEKYYADYANSMKAMANEARKEYLKTEKLLYSPAKNKEYKEEVKSLDIKLMIANKNAPLERQAQLLANKLYSAQLRDNPDLDDEHKKKAKGRALNSARLRVGAKKQRIDITDKEWEAIQAGAISESKLNRIIDNTDLDSLKQRATPRTNQYTMTRATVNLAKSMSKAGYTASQIADSLGVSASTISKAINGLIEGE